jgi:rhodanese-related sulfurtransferase
MHLRQALPVADVRAEAEYEAGHIPGARNLPLLHNEARQAGVIKHQQLKYFNKIHIFILKI